MGDGGGNRVAESDRAQKVLSVYSALTCERVLDIGCGSGALSVEICEACDAEQIYGVDESKPRLTQAAARGVNAVCQDINAGLAFKSERFHSIHAGEVLDYIDDPVDFLNEVHRCLTPKGIFVVSTANLAALHNRIALVLGKPPYPLRGSVDSETSTDNTWPPILSNRDTLFTLPQLQRLLEREGFAVLDTIPARSEPVDTSLLLAVFEDLLAYVPRLSYRNIIVCRKGP